MGEIIRVLSKPAKLPLIGPLPRYYFLLTFLFLLYLASKSILVGLLAGLLMVAIVLFEFYQGAKEGGLKNELKSTAIAIGLVVAAWLLAGFLLQTSNPINAIVSCSMMPAYERGDFVILAGGTPQASKYAFSGPASAINSTAHVLWEAGAQGSGAPGGAQDPWLQADGAQGAFDVNGSLLAYCTYRQASDARCVAFIQHPEQFAETHGPLRFEYGRCGRMAADGSGRGYDTICVKKTYFQGKEVPFEPDASDLIVYAPAPGELYARVGDIVHRARLRISTADGIIYLTKGDNNPIYDLQAYDDAHGLGNSPITPSQLKGHVVLRIPYLGNLKLFLSPQILADPSALSGCDSYFEPGSR